MDLQMYAQPARNKFNPRLGQRRTNVIAEWASVERMLSLTELTWNQFYCRLSQRTNKNGKFSQSELGAIHFWAFFYIYPYSHLFAPYNAHLAGLGPFPAIS
jgi:hypothetical protein